MATNHGDTRPPAKVWCEERATTMATDADGEEYEVVHLCRYHEGQHPTDGQHACWLCKQTWHGQEPPC